jgi:4-alpha-glucanotransferase
MPFQRASGILLHLTSLPGRFGIGELGPEAFEFIDFLARSGQAYWQVLPLNPTGYGDSPYQCFSTFAGNTLLISLQKLADDGFLSPEELDGAPQFAEGSADYGGVIALKGELLKRAFTRFTDSNREDLQQAFDGFCAENSWWLEDHALYQTLREANDFRQWNEWDEKLAKREAAALEAAREQFAGQIREQKFYQYLFFKQWNELRAYAREKNVKFIGDVPIYVSHNSSDVWCEPHLFKLNEDGSSSFVAGVPPDAFSKTGQLWGNPVYNWDAMRAEEFGWWVKRVAFTLQTVDVTRIDHFRGFAEYWEVPGKDKTAEQGQWVGVPGRELFETLKEKLGELPVIVEDLGFITPDVEKLRDDFDFPGMKILQFAFGSDASHPDLPHNLPRNCATYTGTHDSDTAVGWFKDQFDKQGNISPYGEYCLKYLNSDGAEINWDFIRVLSASVADTVIILAQDLLGLGNEARMNLPATLDGNWKWRLQPGELTDEIADRLGEISATYGRKF